MRIAAGLVLRARSRCSRQARHGANAAGRKGAAAPAAAAPASSAATGRSRSGSRRRRSGSSAATGRSRKRLRRRAIRSTCARRLHHPNALGVGRPSRSTPRADPDLVSSIFKQLDFLRDKEVVLTFDDGPWRSTRRRS